MPIVVVAVLALLFVLWLLLQPRWVAQRRARWRAQPVPQAWLEVLNTRVPYLGRLPADLRHELNANMQVFLAEKAFIGCDGFVITDEVRVTIAAQACLLLLGRPTDYFPKLRQVLVYPGSFVVDGLHSGEGNLELHHGRQALAGESWFEGQVVLAWDETLEDAQVPDDGRNVVIHEFAHQLDMENGDANGVPLLPSLARYRRWSQVMDAEFARLQQLTLRRQPCLIDPYGASHPAEFFAVISEAFFEQGTEMAHQLPQLYAELRGFYGVDPAAWKPDSVPVRP